VSKALEYLPLLYAAKASPEGIVVQTDDPLKLRQRLYTCRREIADPDLDELSFVESPTNPNEHLWIVRRKDEAKS
jgi:hypothetical protein